MAAIQIAKHVGAEIFATAGNEEKREYLRSLGVQHVLDSRSLGFAEKIMEITKGEGVHLVLNSLTGEALEKSYGVLAPFGRFFEIGKKDIYQNTKVGLGLFKENISYFAVDVEKLAKSQPSLFKKLLNEILDLFGDKTYSPLPLKSFPVSEVENAFRFMSQGKHMGKIILSMENREDFPVIPGANEENKQVSEEGTYLITGGLGGLGLKFADWLVEQGARHLVLVGRRGMIPEAETPIADLKRKGAQIHISKGDIAKKEDVQSMLDQIGQTMPPLKGIIHSAGLLDDSTISRLDREKFYRVLKPKVQGTWHLHQLTLNHSLDFFVCFSSAVSILGSPGQGNYTAANSFLDSLIDYRHQLGLPGLSVNWGPWSEVGLAAQQSNRGERISFRGLGSLTPDQGVKALDILMQTPQRQMGVFSFHLRQWKQFYPKLSHSPLFNELQEQKGMQEQEDSFQKKLQSASSDQKFSLLKNYLVQEVSQILRLSIKKISTQTPLRNLGLDSLMALEFRNRLEFGLGLSLSTTMIWKYPTINALLGFLEENLNLGNEKDETTPESPSEVLPEEKQEEKAEEIAKEKIEEEKKVEEETEDDELVDILKMAESLSD